MSDKKDTTGIKEQKEVLESLERIAKATELTLKANKEKEVLEAAEKKKKEGSLKSKSFNAIKEGAKSESAQTLMRGLMDSNPMTRALAMVDDTLGVSTKVKEAYDKRVAKKEDEVQKAKEKAEEVLEKANEEAQQKVNEAKQKIADAEQAIEVEKQRAHEIEVAKISASGASVKSAASETLAPKVDKDVQKEQFIQQEKDRMIFESMRDNIEIIANKEFGVKEDGGSKKDDKEEGGIFSAIASFLGAKLGPVFSTLGSFLFKPFKSIGSLIMKPFKFLGGTLSKFTGEFGNVLKGFGGKFGKIFSGKGGLLSKLGGMVKGLIGSVGNMTGKAAGALGSVGGKALGVLGKGLKFLGPIGAALGVAASGLSGFMEAENIFGKDATIGNKISATIGGIASGLTLGLVETETMAKGIQAIGDSIADVGKATWDGVKAGAGFIGNVLSDGASLYKDALKAGADAILGVFGTSTDELAKGLKDKFDGMLDMFSGIGDWFGSKFDKAKGFAKDKANALTGNYEQARKEGKGVVSSAWEGVKGYTKSFSGEAGDRKTALEAQAKEAGITDPKELAMFMGQMSHETAGFTATKEGKYSADTVWRLRGKQLEKQGVTKEQVQAAYKSGGSSAMDEFMYSDKYRTGNNKMGNDKAGDATKYKGRGYVQLTGKNNYKDMTKKLQAAGVNVDLVKNPEMAEDPKIAAMIATKFWKDSGASKAAQEGNIDKVSQKINGGALGKSHGAEDRKKQTANFLAEYDKDGVSPGDIKTSETASTSISPEAVKGSSSIIDQGLAEKYITGSSDSKAKNNLVYQQMRSANASANVSHKKAEVIPKSKTTNETSSISMINAVKTKKVERENLMRPQQPIKVAAPSNKVSMSSPTAQAKSTVGDSDLLLLSGVFLSK